MAPVLTTTPQPLAKLNATRSSVHHPDTIKHPRGSCAASSLWAAAAARTGFYLAELQFPLLSLALLHTALALGVPALPERLNPDWCRLRTAGAGALPVHGVILAADVGATALVLVRTSWTGPS